MTTQAVLTLTLFLVVLLAFAYPLSSYLTRIADQQRALPAEGWIYRIAGVDAQSDMNWKQYAVGLLVFHTIGVLFVYALQRLQLGLPLNRSTWRRSAPIRLSTPRSVS